MKTAISVPDPTFVQVEEAARRLGISRSEFYATAAQRWVDELREDEVTDQINAVLDDGDSSPDTTDLVAEAARRSFAHADEA